MLGQELRLVTAWEGVVEEFLATVIGGMTGLVTACVVEVGEHVEFAVVWGVK